MFLSGALAGLAAAHYVLGGGIDEYRLKQSLPYSVGFDGIAVALMGQNTPLGWGSPPGFSASSSPGAPGEPAARHQPGAGGGAPGPHRPLHRRRGLPPPVLHRPLRAAEVELKAEKEVKE